MARARPKHLLVIRLSAMGDVAMTVPVLLALREKYPSVLITVLTKPFFAPIVLGVPGVSVKTAQVKTDHKGILGLWRLFKELRQLNIDAVADLHNVMRSKVLRLFFVLHGIPFIQIDKGRSEKKRLTARKNKRFEPLRTTHQRYADVFSKLGLPVSPKKTHVLPKMKWRGTHGISLSRSKKWLGIAPFAAFPGKTYPKKLMEMVLMHLNKEQNLQLVLFGGGVAEKKQLQKWAAQFQNCFCLAGELAFSEELALISNLDAMLAMDSGNAHLAAMYGVPTITLWGVTHPFAGFYPFAQPTDNALLADRKAYPMIPTSVYGNKLPKGYENAMGTIGPLQVVEKVRSVLGGL